jgi:ribosomal protein S18 acetylase RimI-like enzyme
MTRNSSLLSKIKITNVQQNDIDQLVEIENSGFTPERAATKEAFQNRIINIPDSFLVARISDEIIGFINGPVIEKEFIANDLLTITKPNPDFGEHQSILGLVVHPDYRKQGIGSFLLNELEKVSKSAGRQSVTLTCLESLIPFYESNGYINQGVSNSTHGGEIWMNLTKNL